MNQHEYIVPPLNQDTEIEDIVETTEVYKSAYNQIAVYREKMKKRQEDKLKALQEQERQRQIAKGISPKFMEFSNEIIEAGPEDEEEEGVIKDMDEFRQMKFNKDDDANAVVTKKSVADFDPNYGVRVGEGKRFNKSPSKSSKAEKYKDKLDKDQDKEKSNLNLNSFDGSVQNDSPGRLS